MWAGFFCRQDVSITIFGCTKEFSEVCGTSLMCNFGVRSWFWDVIYGVRPSNGSPVICSVFLPSWFPSLTKMLEASCCCLRFSQHLRDLQICAWCKRISCIGGITIQNMQLLWTSVAELYQNVSFPKMCCRIILSPSYLDSIKIVHVVNKPGWKQ